MHNISWAVEIQKTSLDRRNLCDLLTGLGFQLVYGDEFDAFTSPSIERCDTAEEVWSEAKRLREVFTGSAQIDLDFTLGSIIDYTTTPPKRHAFLEAASGHIKISGGVATLTVSPPLNLSEEQLAKWHAERSEQEYQAKLEAQRGKLEPAFLCSRAPKVLELLNVEDPSGETLYKIYELAEGHPSNRSSFQSKFGVTKDEFERFKDAVHNPVVSGDWARHAYKDKPKTSNPMSIAEAKTFIRDLVKIWFTSIRETKSG